MIQNKILCIGLVCLYALVLITYFTYTNNYETATSVRSLNKKEQQKQQQQQQNQLLFQFSSEEKLQTESFNQTNPSQTTVIALYIELNKSKHSVDAYDNWMRNFAVSVGSPLAIVINRKAYLKLAKLRVGGTTKYYVVEDIWAILKQVEIERNKSYIQDYLKRQHDLDPEKGIHNPHLYAVWNLKAYCAYKISQENPFNSKFFIYTDTGAFRERFVANWPDTDFIENSLLAKLNDRILFGQINGFGQFAETQDIIEGTFFAGSAKALQSFYTNFFALHDQRLARGLFIGKEQDTMNLVSFVFFNQTVVRLQTWGLSCSFNYDQWFFYQVNQFYCFLYELKMDIKKQFNLCLFGFFRSIFHEIPITTAL